MRRRLVEGLVGVLLVWAVPAAAQRPGGMPTIAVLAPGNPAGSGTGESRMLDAFREGLREQGYVEGQNV